MADDPKDILRLALMQDVLPVGLAIFERVKQGGASKVAEAFSSSDDPLQELKIEGELAAKTVRAQLDNVSPGLGNPVVPVKVDIEFRNSEVDSILDQEALLQCLGRIQVDIQDLETFLLDDCTEKKPSISD